MDPLPHISHSLAPGYQTICYLPRLKVSVALRYVRTFPWVPEAWGEVRLHDISRYVLLRHWEQRVSEAR